MIHISLSDLNIDCFVFSSQETMQVKRYAGKHRGVNSPDFRGSLPQFCRKFRNLPQSCQPPAFRKYNRHGRDFSLFIPV